ncbi:MAG: 30S ribosomal protein S6 [Bacteroidota bacterium]|nr:30S ribosomal protein S6 [Bacteroidota bacterium]
MKDVAGKFRDYLVNNQAEIVSEENWGLRKLAYPIKKKSTGFYHLMEFTATAELVSRLEVEYKRDERVLRFLTVSLDKYGVEFNERRRRGEFNKERKEKRLEKVEERD